MSSQAGEESLPPADSTTIDGAPIDLLAELEPELAEGARFISEELREGWCSPLYTRQVIHNRMAGEGYKVWPRQVDELFTKFAIASAGVIIRESGADEDPGPLADELFHARLEQGAEDPDLQFLPSRISEAVVTTRHAQEHAGRITEGLRELVTDAEARDALLSLLVAPIDMPGDSPATSDQDRAIQALKLFDTFTALEGEDASLGTVAADALKNGELDEFAAEALFHCIDDEDALIEHESRREGKKLLRLGMYLTGEDEGSAVERLITPEARALWPEALAKLLNRGLADFEKAFNQNRTNYHHFLRAFRCLPPAASEGVDLTHLAEDILLETAKIRSTDTDVPMPKRVKALGVIDTMEKRKRRRPPTEPTPVDAPLGPEDGEDKPEIRRDLVYVRSDGSEAPEGSDECSAIFDDFASKHRGMNGLVDDLASIREWLKTMDLSAGIPRGIKTLGGGQTLKRGEAEFSKVYQLKPSEAVGLSIASGLGSKIRVIFVMKDNTLGILGIASRDDMRAMTNKLGIRGRSRRK